ncbi:MAG: dUTP diphosphatase, partial [Ilumatobacteraceae bacterium]
MTTGADGLRVDVQRLDPEMPLPAYAHPGDAGIDLYARESIVIRSGGGRVLMPTGIAVAIPLGWAGFVLPRSGLALKHGLSVVNSPGLIDSAYRGEL